MSLSIVLSIIAILLSIVSIVINRKIIKECNNMQKNIPRKLYAKLKTRGVFKAKLLCYISMPFVYLGLIDQDKVIEKAVSFIDVDVTII